jgi:hypothetical protein
MFPIAHLWLLERVVPEATAAHRIGAVWPDMLFGAPLTHVESHQRGDELLAFARSHGDDPEFAAFVAGVITHGSEPHGFDWYSDECYGGAPLAAKGYAFQRGRPLAPAVATACGLPPADGPWKAHNIVEMAFESPLHSSDPGLADGFVCACADRALVGRIAARLAVFYRRPADALAGAVLGFAAWWVAPTSERALADVYARQVRQKHAGASPDPEAIGRLIGAAGEIIAPDRDAYLAGCVAAVSDLLGSLGIATARRAGHPG